MREALAIVAEEGLEQMWARHRAMHERLWRGLSSLGLHPLVQSPGHRLPSVNAIKVRLPQTCTGIEPAVKLCVGHRPCPVTNGAGCSSVYSPASRPSRCAYPRPAPALRLR